MSITATTAIIAGAGRLPGLLQAAGPLCVVRLAGMPSDATGPAIDARLEQFGALFEALRAAEVREICFAGAVTRTAFDPTALDDVTRGLLPRIMAAQMRGDDALLREIVAIFEEQGFVVRGAHEVRPDLLAGAGGLHGPEPDAGLARDAARARAVLAALGPHDVGQAAVAADGQLLGIETLQGTDAMLRFVAETRKGSGGVLVKRAKPGQDLRVDMPAIGPDTIAHVAEAGLRGIEVQAGHVLLLDAGAVHAACAAQGIALWGAP